LRKHLKINLNQKLYLLQKASKNKQDSKEQTKSAKSGGQIFKLR